MASGMANDVHLEQLAVSLPRQVLPGSILLVTRRCVQRQFLLRPDPKTRNAVIYCLAVAAARFEIAVLDFVAMSNHLHYVIQDRHGNSPAFFEYFHKLVAKCMNARWGRWENFFASTQTSVVRLTTREAVIKELVYVATNPVNDGLVAYTHQWPGALGHHALVRKTVLHAERPTWFFAAFGAMPKRAELELTIPVELGDRAPLVAEVRDQVAAIERRNAGRSVIGRAALMRQSPFASPSTLEPRRGMSPRVAAVDTFKRLEAIQRNRDFVKAYRHARAAFKAGRATVFPTGTYWLRRFAGVTVASENAM